jgi:hypothetical protein
MAVTIVFVALAFGLVVLLVFLLRCWLFGRHLVRNFERSNVVVDGHKGKGKDLVFQYVIRKRKAPYYANIEYGGEFEKIDPLDISVYPNTYENFIGGKVVEVPRRFAEGKDIYLSDGGIYFPSYADSILHKTYKSLPLYYPMSRHLANHNIHVNIQNLERLWKPIREQADFFVHVRGRVILPFFILVRANTYDKYQSALQCLDPVKPRLLNKFSKSESDVYKATNGEIKTGWIIVRKSKIDYDTRAFEKVIYGDQPRIEK